MKTAINFHFLLHLIRMVVLSDAIGRSYRALRICFLLFLLLWRTENSPPTIWLMFFFHHKALSKTKKIGCKCNNSEKKNYFILSSWKYILQEDQDWGFVAMVLDRLFLWLFTTASLFGTFSILCEAPALWVFSRNFPPDGTMSGRDEVFKVYFNLLLSPTDTMTLDQSTYNTP